MPPTPIKATPSKSGEELPVFMRFEIVTATCYLSLIIGFFRILSCRLNE
jgi:hypothetical protein